jgi:aspartate-semialdehyde dehydrogenase
MNKTVDYNSTPNHPSPGKAEDRLFSSVEIERGLSANVIGATGLVGKQLVQQLLDEEYFSKVRIFVRSETGLKHPKLEQQIIDFAKTETWAKLLTGDVLFFGTGNHAETVGQ